MRIRLNVFGPDGFFQWGIEYQTNSRRAVKRQIGREIRRASRFDSSRTFKLEEVK